MVGFICIEWLRPKTFQFCCSVMTPPVLSGIQGLQSAYYPSYVRMHHIFGTGSKKTSDLLKLSVLAHWNLNFSVLNCRLLSETLGNLFLSWHWTVFVILLFVLFYLSLFLSSILFYLLLLSPILVCSFCIAFCFFYIFLNAILPFLRALFNCFFIERSLINPVTLPCPSAVLLILIHQTSSDSIVGAIQLMTFCSLWGYTRVM